MLAVLLPLACVLALAGCGSDSSDDPGSDASDEPVLIDITFSGSTVTPSGDRVKVAVGQTVELHVKADEPGEIHVHSTPEQEIEYDAGTSEHDLTIDKPGIVEVESHSLDQVIVQLEVS
ncbi:hypothetical protein ISG29_11745 [Nocardioides sp. CBS4Y-1]|uniref:EfeO-type cupredoxin-like domain-containing protein n=1 Tax=Nocardioides acrostichi TaxID=2784339 RepID=A0A930V373_9ACTN|nr:hypothetical protein [Nocardioides acrostichi]